MSPRGSSSYGNTFLSIDRKVSCDGLQRTSGEPVYQETGRFIREGQIGGVISFSATGFHSISKDNKYYKTDWRTVPDLSCSLVVSTTSLTLCIVVPGRFSCRFLPVFYGSALIKRIPFDLHPARCRSRELPCSCNLHTCLASLRTIL